MTNSYDKAALKTDPVMRARLQLGDTGRLKDDAGATVWMLEQDEIDAMVVTFGYSEGVAVLADSLAVRFAQEPDRYTDESGVAVVWTQRIKEWSDLADKLRSGDVSVDVSVPSGVPLAKVSDSVDASGFR